MSYADKVVRGKDPYADADATKLLLNDLNDRVAGGAFADVAFTIGDEDTNVREIEIQAIDGNGDPIDGLFAFRLYVFADAAGAALATTGGSTGIALGTAGGGILAVTATAKKVFDLITEPDGHIDLKWTDTGTEAVYLGIVLPNGVIRISDVVQNAGD